MNFTFAVITHDNSDEHLGKIITSIQDSYSSYLEGCMHQALHFPDIVQEDVSYEIIFMGKEDGSQLILDHVKPEDGRIKINSAGEMSAGNITCVKFDETRTKAGWITKKKNDMVKMAKYDNIVFIHDYVTFEPDWFDGFVKFGDDWDIAMSVIINHDGTRFRDWISFDDPDVMPHRRQYRNSSPQIAIDFHSAYMPSYDYDKTQYMYISGSYWVAKKHVMEAEPLDERLLWGETEDIEWSFRVRDKYKYVMNTYSAVKLMRYKDNVWWCDPEHLTNEYITKDLV